MAAVGVAEPRLALLEAALRTAERSLGGRTPESAIHVTTLLTRVVADLADLAAGADTETAAKLTALRSDVSGHLLAAATLESAGAPARASQAMLRRATDAARAGLHATYGFLPAGA